MHPARKLWRDHLSVGRSPHSWPAGVAEVPEPIVGTAFFPGGYGLWRPNTQESLPPLPIGGVLVLGQDFDTIEGYRISHARGTEYPHVATWSRLKVFLDDVEVMTEECFFTNVFLGLRASGKNSGRFPGRRDPEFVARCLDFLRVQLNVLRPRLILTLGVPAFRFLGRLGEGIGDWAKTATFTALDLKGPVRAATGLVRSYSHSTPVVALIHPSFRPANVWRRNFQGRKGEEAETAMVNEGISLSRR